MTRAVRRVAGILALGATACGGPSSTAPQIVDVELPAGGSTAVAATRDDPGPPPVHVVRLGAGASLAALLRDQALSTAASGDQVVVMTIGAPCPACVRLLDALDTAPLRDALRGVVLVRVDVPRFERELAPLGLDSYVLPAFFLLDDRGHARDGITSAEWTDDLPENIAPVLRAFANEAYVERRAPLAR